MSLSVAPPVVTLTTDFGNSDHYVGAMKGVILSRCSNALIVDITHDIPAFSILAGAYAISQAAPYFPRGTVHVIVVDPGVGTTRKPIFVEAAGQFFIAPDNGVLDLATSQADLTIVREVTNPDLFLPQTSATFHGRDIFAPTAGSIANGSIKPEDVGPVLANPIRLQGLQPQLLSRATWQGLVLSADRFGNIITNFLSREFSPDASHQLDLVVNGHHVSAFYKTFGDATAGVVFWYHGSSGFIEIGLKQESAATALGVSLGDSVLLRLI